MEEPLPIVFLHRGPTYMVHEAMLLARKWNPKSTIYFLTDQPKAGLVAPEAEVLHLDDFSSSAVNFLKHYRHFSDQSIGFEMFCFARWFVLLEFMQQLSIPRCVHLDSDCYLFSDVSQSLARFAECDMTLSYSNGHYCGHIALFNSIYALGLFCQYCHNRFSENSDALKAEIARDLILTQSGLKRYATPLNDMYLFNCFRQNFNLLIGDTAVIYEGSAFDHALGFEESSYELEHGIKKLRWEDGAPYAWHIRKERWIRMNALHLQGPSKAHVGRILAEALPQPQALAG